MNDYRGATPEDLATLNEVVELLIARPMVGSKTPEQGRLLRSVFERWARMGNIELDLLNKVGGPETIRLAEEINRIGRELE